jgi:hypothetical protein
VIFGLELIAGALNLAQDLVFLFFFLFEEAEGHRNRVSGFRCQVSGKISRAPAF